MSDVQPDIGTQGSSPTPPAPTPADLMEANTRLMQENTQLRRVLGAVQAAARGEALTPEQRAIPLVAAIHGIIQASRGGGETRPCPVCQGDPNIQAGIVRATGQPCRVCHNEGTVVVRAR